MGGIGEAGEDVPGGGDRAGRRAGWWRDGVGGDARCRGLGLAS